jgi:hypothetical protein
MTSRKSWRSSSSVGRPTKNQPSGQEGPLRPQPGAKGRPCQWRISADRNELAEAHRKLGLKLHELAHVMLVARAEEAAAKDQY